LSSEGLFSPFWQLKKYLFLIHIKFPINIFNDHTYFGTKIWFLSSECLFSPSRPPKAYIFFICIKFLFDGYITWPYWFWSPHCGLWRLIFAFSTSKSIIFLTTCKITNRWMYHTTTLIMGPIIRFWALKVYFQLFDPLKSIFSYSM
jgi:hypothetical protein